MLLLIHPNVKLFEGYDSDYWLASFDAQRILATAEQHRSKLQLAVELSTRMYQLYAVNTLNSVTRKSTYMKL